MQSLPLELKIKKSQERIREWYNYWNGNVYVAFSGGKDSTVLLDLVRNMYPEVPAVFADTGLEYPEIKDFVKNTTNIIILRPDKSFKQVIEEYGYPVVSKKVARQIRDLRNPTVNNISTRNLYLNGIKRDGSKTRWFKLPNKWVKLIDAPFKISEKCCDIMKKEPFHKYEKSTGGKGYIGVMASDSLQRESSYLKTGCNNFKGNTSHPIAFWTGQDVWNYIKKYNLKYCSIYNTGVKHTGCIFCCFGVHLEKEPNRFQLMAKTHPKLYKYCINDLGIGRVLDYIEVKY